MKLKSVGFLLILIMMSLFGQHIVSAQVSNIVYVSGDGDEDHVHQDEYARITYEHQGANPTVYFGFNPLGVESHYTTEHHTYLDPNLITIFQKPGAPAATVTVTLAGKKVDDDDDPDNDVSFEEVFEISFEASALPALLDTSPAVTVGDPQPRLDPPIEIEGVTQKLDLTRPVYFTVESSAPIHEVGITISNVDPENAAQHYTLYVSSWFSPHGSGTSTANVSITQADLDLENTDIPGAEITVRVAHSAPGNPTVEIFRTFTFWGRERPSDSDQPDWPNPGTVEGLRQGLTEGTDIVIRWGPPLNTGSSLISHYEVRHRNYTENSEDATGFGGWFSTGAVLRINLSTTTGIAGYDVEVRAVNADGLAGSPVRINDLTLATAPGVAAADALPSVSSEERARIASALAMDRVIFNELRNATTDTDDWIELRNVSDTDVTLDGWEVRIIADEGTGIVTFPLGTVLPAGGLLLLVNTDPDAPEMPLSMPEGDVVSVVDAELILPQTDFTLLLRSDAAWEDSAGNYFFGYEVSSTAPSLTTDTAWYRARPDVLGYQLEAWVASGYQDGRGYDADVPVASALGTPGSPQSSLVGDVNGDGTVNILDVVFVASRFDATDASAADVNGDGVVNIQDLVLVADRLGDVAAAPSAETLHASHVEQWLASAKHAVAAGGIETASAERLLSYERGIQVLEHLLATLVPQSTALLANYPNPFNPETWIPYRLATGSDVQLRIYDTRGRIVRDLDIGHQAAGLYETRSRAAYWDGRNEIGESVASGLYFYTLTAGDFAATRRMLILK